MRWKTALSVNSEKVAILFVGLDFTMSMLKEFIEKAIRLALRKSPKKLRYLLFQEIVKLDNVNDDTLMTTENPGVIDLLKLEDINTLVHELRTLELRKLPPGAKTLLSAGCAGLWYFEWIAKNYEGFNRHIGIEAYSPKPENLPEGVEWISNTVGNMTGVKDHEVDLVFSGQNIEHLWPEDIWRFFCEAHRVLRPGGRIVIDSPNRRITTKINWHHPEHIVEFEVEEIIELATYAGFTNLRVRGLWLCYDRDQHILLPLFPDNFTSDQFAHRRIHLAAERPEDSFIWWLTGQKSENFIDRVPLKNRVEEIFIRNFQMTSSRFLNQIGTVEQSGFHRIVRTSEKEAGYLVYGPYIPLKSGKYTASFKIKGDAGNVAGDQAVCTLDIYSTNFNIIAQQPIPYSEITPGKYRTFDLNFHLENTAFGTEFRVIDHGLISLSSRLNVEVSEMS